MIVLYPKLCSRCDLGVKKIFQSNHDLTGFSFSCSAFSLRAFQLIFIGANFGTRLA